MKLYEFQAKKIFERYGINVPRGKIISYRDEVQTVCEELQASKYVLKAQVHAGGRGKAGGIKFANTVDEVRSQVDGMLGARLVTNQTGAKGFEIKNVLLAESIDIKKEFYLSITIDRTKNALILIASAEGGVEIEEVAKRTPDKIMKEPLDIFFGIHPFQIRRVGARLNISGKLLTDFQKLVMNLFHAFVENDCSLLEINPLAETKSGVFCAIDAKMEIDDNALFRHPDFNQFLFHQEVSNAEELARKYSLSYINLDGNIGCLVNGAGLAMATMDIIKLYGGEPANFLDVGGDASMEQVTQAFKIILSDPKVKAILINIFGGIMKCDIIANGIIQAIKEVGIHIPLVVRLEGTNVDIAKKILDGSGLKIISAQDMKDAASKVVKVSEQ